MGVKPKSTVLPRLLTIALLFVAVSSMALPASAVKSGQVCKKSGATSTYKSAGKTVNLRCMKVAKKLLWVKVATTAVKSGQVCKKSGATSSYKSAGKTVNLRCMKVAKKLLWVKVATTTATTTTTIKSTTNTTTSAPTSTTSTSAPTSTTSVAFVAGESCSSLGASQPKPNGSLECRKISGGGLRWFSLSTSPAAPERAAGSYAVSACQLTDQRTTKTPPSMMTGFPALTTNQPLTGALTYAVIPIDFSDAPGTYAPLSEAQSQMDELAAWTNRISGGKITITYRTSSTWTRVPSVSTAYNLARSGFGLSLAQDALAAADPSFDFTGISTVLFYLPRTIEGVGEGFNANDGGNGMRISTNEGVIRFWFGAGKYFYADGRTVWSYWAHEIGHAFGLIDLYVRSWASSAPPPMAGFDIMASQDGPSRTLSSWWRFLLGWYNDNQVYCIPSSALTQVTVTLVPIDRSTDGYKAVMVPLTASRILVIESRRREFYDVLFPVGSYGTIAYVIDTTIDNGDGTSVLQVPIGHSTIWVQGSGPVHDAFILKGESVTVSGITVTLVESDDYDTVKISK